MSHVDEGTLHALLDGALSAVAPADAERVELHLAACADCRARLDEAARVRAEATALLGSAQPREYVLPSFDAIRARASLAGPMLTTRPRSFLRSPFNDFAWAAMVVLALGLGWMLNDTMESDTPVRVPSPDVAESGRSAAPDQDIRMFPIPTGGSDSVTVQTEDAGEAAENRLAIAGPPSEPLQTPTPALEFTVSDRGAEYDVVAEEEAPASPPVVLQDDADERFAAAAAPERADAAGRDAVSSRVQPAPAPAVAGQVAGVGAELGALEEGWRSITLVEARRLTNDRIVRIGGARVVSSAARGSGAELEVQTVQLTDRGESIKVVQRRTPPLDARRRAEMAAEAERPAGDVVTAGLTVQLEDWTVTISGAVAPERLRELAAGLS